MVCQNLETHKLGINWNGLVVSKHALLLVATQLFPPCTAPDAAPTNVSTSSTLRNQIDVSWNPPPEEFQNGVIILYLVRYADINATLVLTMQTTTTTSLSLTRAISAGTTYLVSVAAVTSVGGGPFSGNISQRTLSPPPPFPEETPSQSPDIPLTNTTIRITLPAIPSLQEYRYTYFISYCDSSYFAYCCLSSDPSMYYIMISL